MFQKKESDGFDGLEPDMGKTYRGKGKPKNGGMEKLKLLNPKNLQKEVHMYGYNFSARTYVLLVIGSLLGIGAVGVLFRLNPGCLAATLLAMLGMLPVLILDMYKRMYEQKRFADAVTYMEQMLYSFQKSGKIASALRETQDIFEGGQMRDAIGEAIAYLERGYAQTERGVMREALEKIEKYYMCHKIQTVHELLVNNEEYGGDSSNAIYLILNDLELWKRRGYKLQAQKKQSHMDNIISMAASTALCAVALYVLDGMGKLFPAADVPLDIFDVGLIQASSFIFLLCMMFVLLKSAGRLTSSWLVTNALHDDGYIISSYEKVMTYDDKKERKKSLLWALPFLGLAAAGYFIRPWLSVLFLLAAAFMLIQHRVGYNLAKKDTEDELYVALPQWLMTIALLLQTNNVQVSIRKSIEDAPAVLQEELILLDERVSLAPDRLSSYTDFCRKFDVPEIASCMKMLHAISENGTGNARIQVENLIARVNEMQTMADAVRDRNTAFKMKMIFSYPVLAATGKLLVDLTVGMIYMFQMLGSMGSM